MTACEFYRASGKELGVLGPQSTFSKPNRKADSHQKRRTKEGLTSSPPNKKWGKKRKKEKGKSLNHGENIGGHAIYLEIDILTRNCISRNLSLGISRVG